MSVVRINETGYLPGIQFCTDYDYCVQFEPNLTRQTSLIDDIDSIEEALEVRLGIQN